MKRGLKAALAGGLAFVLLAAGGVFVLLKDSGGPVSYEGASARRVQIMAGDERVAELALGPAGPSLLIVTAGEAAQTAAKAVEELRTRRSLPLLMEDGKTASFLEIATDDQRFVHAVCVHLKASYGLDARPD